jgi:signal transduction histidine kinase
MAAMPRPADSPSADELNDTMAEVRQLIVDLRDAAQDGRELARRYSEILQNVVDEYCVEFEQRAASALAKLESHR